MDDDQLTQQRAMDAAAAVAVAAAAAAHQNQRDSVGAYTQERSMPMESVRKLQEGDETFTDESLQYIEPDTKMENGNNSHLDESQSSSNRPTVHHTKRRKVNTCIPCKRRKVKCDRERPYCGQCKKHNFPASECTWSAVVLGPSHVKRRNSGTSGIAAAADAAADAVTSATGSGSGSQWYEMSSAPWSNFPPLPVDQSSQALASRVADLEAANAALVASRTVDLNGDTSEQWDVKGNVMSEAERGMAADALAMIAQHEPQANIPSSMDFSVSHSISYKGKRLLPSDRDSIPCEALLYHQETTSAQGREIASLLPDVATIRQLVADFTLMQEYGLDTGVNSKLVSSQLDILLSAIDKADEIMILDQSFIALLFYILSFTLEMRDDASELSSNISLPELYYNEAPSMDRQDSITRVAELWSGAGQALLTILEYGNGPNLNTIMALSLKYHYLNTRGKIIPAQNTLVLALSLCDTLGILSERGGDNLNAAARASCAIYLTAQSPLLLVESAQMIYCSLVAQYRQAEHYLVRFTFDFQSIQIKGNFSRALLEMARDFEEARQSDSDPQTLEEKWNKVNFLLGEGNHSDSTTPDAIAKRHSQMVGFQWTILQMFGSQLITKLRRKGSQMTSIEFACQILRYRRWLEVQRPIIFKVTKVSMLQQVTLEAAFLIALRIAERGFGQEEVSGPEPRKELVNAIAYLSLEGEQRQSLAQKMLYYLLDSTDANQPNREGLQNGGIIFDYLEEVCSGKFSRAGEARFWAAMESQGPRLLQSLPL